VPTFCCSKTEIINPEENLSDDNMPLFQVGLWWGSGYILDTYRVYGTSEEDALDNVVAWLDHNNPSLLEHSDFDAETLKQEIMQDKGIDGYEVEEDPIFAETFIYIDATMSGAKAPHYIYGENLKIQRL